LKIYKSRGTMRRYCGKKLERILMLIKIGYPIIYASEC
jgi:hypothetical protein